MLDFSKYAATQEAVVPVLNNRFQYKRKIYQLKGQIEDAWYLVEMLNNKAKIKEQEFISEFNIPENCSQIKGFTFGNNIIFQNFDVAKRKFNFNTAAQLKLNNTSTFSSINAVVWEDLSIYTLSINYDDMKIHEVKEAFDSGQNVSEMKGVTPEHKMLFFYHALQKQKIEAAIAAAEKEKKRREYLQSIPGRLKATLQRIGATLIDYKHIEDRVIFNWKLQEGGVEYNSVVKSDTFEVIESGFCMSGDDRRHNVTSMALLAKEWEPKYLINKTRTRNERFDWYDNYFEEEG